MTNIDIKHACTFTGHRPEKLDAPEAQVKEWLEEQIRQAVADGYTDFITGMQRGVDLWAAEILLKLKQEGSPVRLIAAVAFEGMDKGWTDEWKQLYLNTRKVAFEIHVISRYPGKAAFLKRNDWMVDHASRLIAVSTGAPGGTQKTIDYAVKKGLEVRRFHEVI